MWKRPEGILRRHLGLGACFRCIIICDKNNWMVALGPILGALLKNDC